MNRWSGHPAPHTLRCCKEVFVLVASPGFVREQFCDYMFQQAVKTDNKVLLENRSKFLQVKQPYPG